jgi:hydroxylamine reductase
MGISQFTSRAAALGVENSKLDTFTIDCMFATLTNVNFDDARFVSLLQKADQLIVDAKAMYEKACRDKGVKPEILSGPATWRLPKNNASADDLVKQAKEKGDLIDRQQRHGEDVAGLQSMLLFGLRGVMAYADHAKMLGKTSSEVFASLRDSMRFLGDNEIKNSASVEQLVQELMKVGETTISTLAMLDGAHTSNFGSPVPTVVETAPRKGKAILISGHDLADLEALLRQTEGTGINVYTHGEMLPGHGYPLLKKYPHLAGNYGGAWQNQQVQFAQFKGPIIMTSNCIIEPRKSYKGRIYTTNAAGWPGVTHVLNKDFSAVIAQAKSMEGFTEEPSQAAKDTTLLTGFGHAAVLSHADTIVNAVKGGLIKRFFVVGGCDGAEAERSYFKDVATSVPKDSMILTMGCGKYRFNSSNFGDIGGIPRLLDVGQCNDSYGAVVIALALQKAFGLKSVNDLPISYAISWFEQKAVAVLLAMLKLNIQNIRLGPKAPAFVTPSMYKLLQDNFKLSITGDVQKDMSLMLKGQ